MDEEIFVSCHAPSLSLLLYETARSVHDQKGLLIGQVCNIVISRKTDENEVNHEHKTAIYLEHCIPLDDKDLIGNAGMVNKAKLRKFVDILQNKIVGWYSFRRNSRLVPNSLSEMLIHQSLLEIIPNTKSQCFIACFMSSNVSVNMSTHIFNHIFTTFDPVRGRFEPLRLKIYTLSDESVNSNGYLMKSSFPTSSSFDKIISYVQKEKCEETPVKSVLAIHESVSENLKLMDKKLQNLENHKVQLEQEVENLKKKIAFINKEEILVEEPVSEKLILRTIQFDPNVKYNFNRKMNLLEQILLKPNVPSEKKDEKNQIGSSTGTKTSKHGTGKKFTKSFTPNCQTGDIFDSSSDNFERIMESFNVRQRKS